MKSGAFCVGRTHKHEGSGELTEAAVFARQAAWRDARTMASSIGRERRGALRGVLGTLHLPPSLRDVSHAFGARGGGAWTVAVGLSGLSTDKKK